MQNSAGDQLQNARVKRQYTLEFIAASTGIPLAILAALETGDYRQIGSRLYAVRYGEQYAAFLGITDESFKAALAREWEIYAWGSERKFAKSRRLRTTLAWLYKRHSFFAGVAIAAAAIGGYMLYQMLFLIRQPEILLESPGERNLLVREPFTDIRGLVRGEVRLSVNNRPVNVEGGSFNERLYLVRGVNRILVEAVNDRGKILRRESFVVYTP
ncbi:MAG: hypothetical protein UY71_C0004G0022 [Parcubacteria group bacterium GW2011_GWB1_52_7]|nr:MAG: hypothetical protein UY71_C0004G0022 [Parcubacteria group bacterium GW2011_GWB1_52_7]KKW31213.1 MAG: hypothetical protein UY75_C0013G0002 [Parcubacteria group bacterium GW2011_GWC2_52_8c]